MPLLPIWAFVACSRMNFTLQYKCVASLSSYFRAHVGLSEFLKQLAGRQKELTEMYVTGRERDTYNRKGHC